MEKNISCIYNISYHIIFCPKYRAAVLVDQIEKRLKYLIVEKCTQMCIKIGNMEIMPDHVHLFLKTSPNLRLCDIVGQIKGYSSYVLRKEYIKLKKQLPTLWTRSYYIESIGHISADTIKKYIEHQKKK